MKTSLQFFRRPPGTAKTYLRWAQYFFLLAGFAALGWFAYVQAETFFFQTYQSWRLDQMQQGKPASVALFVKQWLPIPWMQGAPPHSPTASAGGKGSFSVPALPRTSPPRAEGELIGKLSIPRLDLSVIVVEGIDARTLRLAVGHLPGTPLPGGPGNVDLAAHRDTFFRRLKNIRRGDVVTMSTASGTRYSYRVGTIAVVSPNNTSILNASAGPGLNLITCYPFNYVGAAPKRFVVHADQISASARPLDQHAVRDGSNRRVNRQSSRNLTASLIRDPEPPARPATKHLRRSTAPHSTENSLAGVEVRDASTVGNDIASTADENLPTDASSTPTTQPSRPHTNRLRAFFRKIFKPRT